MGRDKKGKPRRRRAWELTPLQEALSAFDLTSLWQLLLAAGRAPGVRHRWSSVGHLLATTIRLPKHGTLVATASDLQHLLTLALEDDPSLSMLEDFMPEDPRDIVEVEFAGRLYRLIGGSVERPVADLERLLVIAEAADPYLESRLGFGLRHLAEVALTHLDSVLDQSVSVSHEDHEVGDADVSFQQRELTTEPEEPQWTGPHALALKWATTDANLIQYDASSPVSAFGSTLCVKFPEEDRARWLPVSSIPEVLTCATSVLAELASEGDWRVRFRFVQLTAERVRRRLWRFADNVIGAPDLDSGPAVSPKNVAQWAVQYGARTLLAVQVIESLSGSSGVEGVPAVVDAASALVDSDKPVALKFAAGSLTLKPGGKVIPVIVHAGSGHLATFGPPGALRLSIEDLDWIARSAKDDMDLLHFAEEMSRGNLPMMFGLETINIWQWWLENRGALFRSGNAPSMMAFELHRGTEEWERAKHLTPLERSLHSLRLPPLREWDAVDRRSPGPANLLAWTPDPSSDSSGSRQDGSELGSRQDGSHWKPEGKLVIVHVSEVPVAFEIPARSSVPEPIAGAVFDLAGAFGFALESVNPIWVEVARGAGVTGVRVELRTVNNIDTAFNVTLIEQSGSVASVLLEVNFESLGDQADGNASVGRSLMAEAFGDLAGLIDAPPEAQGGLIDAWCAAPPTLTINLTDSPFSRNTMRSPISVEQPLEAEVDRQLGSAVHASGVKPGLYPPNEAKDLDRTVLAPVALDLLNERIAPFDRDDLIQMGMVQLERILSKREHLLRDIRNSSGTLNLQWDPVQRQSEIDAEFLKLRRSAELVVEAALLFQPSGDLPLDDRVWAEVIAAAAAYLDATTRSESLHYQVTRSGLEIGPLFDLSLSPWELDPNGPATVNFTEFQRQVADENLNQTMLDADDTAAFQGLLSRADDLVREVEGSSIHDVTVALIGLMTWRLDDRDRDAVAVADELIIAHLLESTVAGGWADGRERMTAALRMLRSDSAGYDRADWFPWRLRSRRNRLLVRPVPTLADGRLVVAPHFCRAALHVYQGYWQAGQLPWSQVGSAPLEKALESVRSHRNLELEQQISQMLGDAGWSVVSRVKPGDGKRIGVGTLTTEIDIVAGKIGSDVVWVLEVKDPAPVYADGAH